MPLTIPATGVLTTAVEVTANPKSAWFAGSQDNPDRSVGPPNNVPRVDKPKYLLLAPKRVTVVSLSE